ncbi:hypothetical protein [Roseivirga misakiensis]|uniref:Uncharacterized protein n=1 Tax=Roseivirga misakiensis TaxID=1563681 RepID=A0A1E5T677_9BACT|nr:hypothetical protein [Roseivirga misakiensis]OEK06879.1 hypothetical protein BFP71_04280 [Roseivirga misakiensis]
MFIRKLFKIGDKAKWLTLELLIVFIGVYLAFLFQGYAEKTNIKKEKEKVLVGLKLELEEFRTGFERFADFQSGKVKEWDSLFRVGEVATYYDWRYIEPQYNFTIIEYALNQKGTDIVSFELYTMLSQIYLEIKKLEHTERLLTELGMKYNIIPNDLDKTKGQGAILAAENRFHFYKFKNFSRDRAGELRRVWQASSEVIKLINEEIGPEKARVVDTALLEKYVSLGVEIDFIKELFDQYFPQYSDEDFQQMLDEIKAGEPK